MHDTFYTDRIENIKKLAADTDLKTLSNIWVREVTPYKWAYNFDWLGRPAIQFPNDAWALQEIIWSVKPDLIIETGIARGGSLIFSASVLAMLDFADAVVEGKMMDPKKPSRRVIGVDIDIRSANKDAIETHPFSPYIQMIQGSSIDPTTIEKVKQSSQSFNRILVCLDSNHTYEHVLKELEAYAPLVSVESYCIVYDTLVDDMPEHLFEDRPWGPGNSPKTAVYKFLEHHKNFRIDSKISEKLLISVAPNGFLKRIDL